MITDEEFGRIAVYMKQRYGIDLSQKKVIVNGRLENYVKHYDLADWARARYEAAPVKASACVGCGLCEARCPYELPIREKLRAAARTFGER